VLAKKRSQEASTPRLPSHSHFQLLTTKNNADFFLFSGCYFGDVACLLNTRRTALTQARTNVHLSVIGKLDLLQILSDFPETKRFYLKHFNVQLFSVFCGGGGGVGLLLHISLICGASLFESCFRCPYSDIFFGIPSYEICHGRYMTCLATNRRKRMASLNEKLDLPQLTPSEVADEEDSGTKYYMKLEKLGKSSHAVFNSVRRSQVKSRLTVKKRNSLNSMKGFMSKGSLSVSPTAARAQGPPLSEKTGGRHFSFDNLIKTRSAGSVKISPGSRVPSVQEPDTGT